MRAGRRLLVRLCTIATSVTVTASLVVLGAAPAAQAAPVYDESQFTLGEVAFNSRTLCIYTCMGYQLAMSRVDVQGPIGNVMARPKVGERFYVHVQTSIVYPKDVTDSYQMRVLLPTGLQPSITAPTDVQCAVTDLANNSVRIPGPLECQDPVQFGLYQQFPAVTLNRKESAHFFFPVVATAPLPAGSTIGLEADPLTNPESALPDPLWSTVPVQVDAAPAGTVPPGSAPAAPVRVASVVSGWPVRPVLARLGRTSVKSVVLPVTVRPARGRVGVAQWLSCRTAGARKVCSWVKYRTVKWPSAYTGRASVLLTAPKGRSVTYRLVLPQTATAKAYVSRALVVRGA